MATKEEDGRTIKGESMDAVHGRERRHQSWKKPPSSQDGGPALLELWMCPTVTSPLAGSCRRFPYHQSGNPWGSFAWRGFVDCFIHENGNNSAGVIVLWRVRDSAEDAEPMCALSRRQSWLPEEGNPARLEALPSLWLDALSRRGPSPREKPLARLARLGEPLQAWRAWSLAKISEECCGPWQAGPWL